ncbi:copper chaperone PCu(A)C [Gemmatimonas sp. UBA7669]|uniref:copper chaperone PCu(A)C n=1 Tax=Gemmatimonas sp. UBA7669 TaxID=1946568 RepID=UPI0025C15C38|nr:copper chaperone PCu(A)C [Gemmatimonas sp. UBA7669]
MMGKTGRTIPLTVAFGAALLAACAGDTRSDTADSTRTASAPLVDQAEVRDAWVRPADSGAMSAAYFVLRTGTDSIVLVGVTSPVARAAEVHESMQHDGTMHMQPRPSLTVAAGDSLVFAPGGLHVMLIDVLRPLAEGDTVSLLLRTAGGDSLHVAAPVRRP